MVCTGDILIDCSNIFNYFINIIKLIREYNNCEGLAGEDQTICQVVNMITYDTITELIDEELRL